MATCRTQKLKLNSTMSIEICKLSGECAHLRFLVLAIPNRNRNRNRNCNPMNHRFDPEELEVYQLLHGKDRPWSPVSMRVALIKANSYYLWQEGNRE